MTATKTARTLLTSQSLAAATAVNASPELNLSTAYGALVAVKLTNGSTAPTTAPVVKFYVGESTGTKRLFYTASGDTVNSSVNDIVCEIPPSAMFVNVTITWGATTGGTVEAYAQELTSI
jgi:hypothetical protein